MQPRAAHQPKVVPNLHWKLFPWHRTPDHPLQIPPTPGHLPSLYFHLPLPFFPHNHTLNILLTEQIPPNTPLAPHLPLSSHIPVSLASNADLLLSRTFETPSWLHKFPKQSIQTIRASPISCPCHRSLPHHTEVLQSSSAVIEGLREYWPTGHETEATD